MMTILSLFLMTQPLPAHPDRLSFGHPGQSRVQKVKRLLRPDGHLFARDEVEPYLQFALKGGL